MFQLHIFYDKHNKKENFVHAIAISSGNCNKDTVLNMKNTRIEGMITKFVVNAIFHHVGILWIIFSNSNMLYETEENNHPDWFNKGTLYNTSICSKLHGKLIEYFIRNARTERYHLMCYIIAHDKQQTLYEDEESIIGDRPIP